MPTTRTFAAFAFVLFVSGPLMARESTLQGIGPGGGAGQGQPKAAGCSPSTSRDELDFNNVRALIETGGNMWQNRTGAGGPAYEVPRTEDRSGPDALFAGSLWMGGYGPDNNLKLAAVRFRQVGNDFWPGPLTKDGTASVEADVCLQYDRTWKTFRQDAEIHRAYHRCRIDPECDESVEFPSYSAPVIFSEWPAHGDVSLEQDYNLAPYEDVDDNDEYDPDAGDYPGYDLDGIVDCAHRLRDAEIPLFGDQNIWWVFNDKGNAHTETGGLPIGMEVRAQAFAFSTNDAVNNMTFYNYVLINQGTQTLQNTFFGQWVDVDLGCADDDYVGCDVQRGLGYAYNGDNNDESCNGHPGYGVQPPAIGVDFFEGPFQDYDFVDNPGPTLDNPVVDCATARLNDGIPYKGIGIGYGDSVVDNERYGMRAFLYHDNNNTPRGDPDEAIQYYGYLTSQWKDGTPMSYSGTGYSTAQNVTLAQYMFPGDSDPVGWGTDCVPQLSWTEENSGNAPFDRRFVQSAGPFTLEPGAYNNITVGVVWARATGGGPFQSVQEVRRADDLAQALFDNCFQILNGPDAPELAIVELDRELIITLENLEVGNNYNESYEEDDPIIPATEDNTYNFQGYQIYQLKNGEVSPADLRDPNLARLVFQCDVEDNVAEVINYITNPDIGLPVPTLMVNGTNSGIQHSFRVTTDAFAQGDPHLVNFKTYYFMAIAYGHNNWATFNPDPQVLSGQSTPYLAGRKAAAGPIRPFSGIPHKNTPENGGTILNASYGDEFTLTRIEGTGNAKRALSLNDATLNAITSGPPWRADELTYKAGQGPIAIKVIDPLAVPAGNFELWFADSITDGDLDDAYWKLVKLEEGDTVYADTLITVGNEQIIPQWGLSVTIEQYSYDGTYTDFLSSSITYADPSKKWLNGVPDGEGEDALNWIRAGTSTDDGVLYPDFENIDVEEAYEDVVVQSTPSLGLAGGTWAPFRLIGDTAFQPGSPRLANAQGISNLRDISSCLVVLTADKSRWTRCPVLEMEDGSAPPEHPGDDKMDMRSDTSVDKNGIPYNAPGCNNDEAGLNGHLTGMGWFPGYAIDLGSGERLNMAFGEASFWGGGKGRDMIWNPTDSLITGLGSPIFGGQHNIYVFGNRWREKQNPTFMPQYDEGVFIHDRLASGSGAELTRAFRACNWVGTAVLNQGYQLRSIQDGLIPTETRILLNVASPYRTYRQPTPDYVPAINPQRNNGLPLYAFNTGERAVIMEDQPTAETACDLINVVPNPYYGFSGYETSRLDNRVKFVNLPQQCVISIYNVSGTLVRRFRKDNALTFLDWDLRNATNVPIASGVYLCHVEVPGVCERVVKFFGVMRPIDLQNF